MKATLLIIDGFGYNPNTEGNAILAAKTPNLDRLWSTYPHTLIKAAEEEVGLSFGQIGNSEVGHMAIGTGRVVPSPLERINNAITDGSFFTNPAFLGGLQWTETYRSRLHIIGLLSSSGIHGDVGHMTALLTLAKQLGVKEVFLHLILDGRDTGPKEAPLYLTMLETAMKSTGLGTIATIAGRAYAMDRNKNWGKTQEYFDALTGSKSMPIVPTGVREALQNFYAQTLDDETIPPTILDFKGTIMTNDVVFLTNFREDRIRQITHALADTDFTPFRRDHFPTNTRIVTMTEYEKGLAVAIAFPLQLPPNTLSDMLEQRGLRQLHLAETEKYAHVTYFFNGGREERLPHEDFINVPSDPPEAFTNNPAMQSAAVTECLLADIKNNVHDVAIVNFAGPDMIGHTGNFDKTVLAVEAIDRAIGTISQQILAENGLLFITADHGNSEQKIDAKTRMPSKDHTINPVPFLMIGAAYEQPGAITRITQACQATGILQDVAPTLLSHLDLPVPEEMTGTNLFP